MNIKFSKKVALFLAIMIFVLSFATTGFAANTIENLKAYYRNIKVFKNGTQVQFSHEPFIVNNTTYVPLRDVSELLDKNVGWDGVNYRIDISDKPDTNLASMMTQIVTQQQTITQLEAKVKSLEAEIAKKPTVSSLSDLEKELNRDYGTYKNVDFEIDLYESKGNIEVRIYIDTYYDGTYWNKISSTNIKTYLQDIVDDIGYEYKDAKITGFIEDEETDKEVVTFTTSTKGVVSVSTKTSGGSSYDYDLEEDLNWKFAGYDGIESIEVSEKGYSISLTIYVYESDWEDLYYSDQEDILEEINEYILDYDDYYSDVYGVIRDDYLLYRFDFDSSGDVDIYK